KPLMRAFRVIAVDLPGFGRSDPPSGWYSTTDYVDFLIRAADELEFREGIVCGVSWGGQIAVQFADKRPERVQALVLVSSSGLRCRGYATAPLVQRLVRGVLREVVLRSPRMIDMISRVLYYDIRKRPADSIDLFTGQLGSRGKRDAFANALLAAAAGDPAM